MYKIASVIVDNPSREVDREFHYRIPDEMSDLIDVGFRVIVPFGRGNKYLEGYVIDIKDGAHISDIQPAKLKDIADIVGDEVLISSEMLRLAVFLRSRYYCTMKEALQTLLPSGTRLKENLYVRSCSDLSKDKYIRYEELLNLLRADKYIDFKKLVKLYGKNLTRSFVFQLEREGILEIRREMEQGVKEKILEVYTPGDREECLNFISNPPGRNKRQAEILGKILENDDEGSAGYLIEKYKCTRGVLKGLEERGLLIKKIKEVYRNPLSGNYSYPSVELTFDQLKAIESILKAYESGMVTSLLHGVTGCGKTEVYLNLVDRFLKSGNSSIILVPEIALTPQTVERFKGRFGDIVAVLHSRLSEGERYDEWRRIKSGSVKVVVGARSAVFAPLDNLKLIVIDEEHETSYKSEISPKYNAREVAEHRVKLNNGLLLLGSATPSFESYFYAQKGVYNLVEISRRVDNKPLPLVKVVDMREELRQGNKSLFSRDLFESIKDNLERKNQTILFLNRRGYSTFISCRSCGHVLKCSHCDVSLTYHMVNNKLGCHYCGMESKNPSTCPSCGSKYIKHFGTGTEKVEEEIKKIFPEAKTLRMDMDTTRKKGDHERIYREFKNKSADILIGTQMVTKGMDFKDVTLVGILAADTTLNLPDFRSPERTFQLITQVSGRAGRGEKPGRVVVQTYDPENYSIKFAKNHDYKGFYNMEIEMRRIMGHPPFLDILYVLLTSEKEEELIRLSMELKRELATFGREIDIEVLGPTPSHISKIKNNYRWNIIFKGNVRKYYNFVWEMLSRKTSGSSINYSIDINPYNMF